MSLHSEHPLVSVVVTTRNEEKNIGNCLRSIREQTYPNIEIIVVDNNSDDRTKEISANFTDKVYNVGPERSAQRNHGLLKVAVGKYRAYFDADMLLAPDLIQSCVDLLEARPNYTSLYIDEVVLGTTFLSRVRRFERSFYTATVVDGSRFFRAEALVQLGGFDEELPPGTEDWDIDIRLSSVGTIALVRNSTSPKQSWVAEFASSNGAGGADCFVGVFHNEAEVGLKKYLAKKSYYGSSLLAYKEKWGPKNKTVRLQLNPLYRILGVFLERGRWKSVIRHPVMFGAILGLRVLVGLGFVFKVRRS